MNALRWLAVPALALAVFTACSAPLPPPPTPTVAITAQPATSSTAPETTLSTTTAEEDTSASAEDDCDAQLAKAQGAEHTTIDDCIDIQQKDYAVRSSCYPDQEAVAFAILDAAECIDDVADAHLAKLLPSIPSPSKDKQKAAHESYRSEVQGYCTRGGCGVNYGAHCVQGMLLCRDSLIQAAAAGTLELDTSAKTGKSIQIMKDFATATCQLPASLWKGGKVPGNCVNRALTWLEACANPGGQCQEP